MQAIEIELPQIGTYAREWLDEHPEHAQDILSRCKGQCPRCLCRACPRPRSTSRNGRGFIWRGYPTQDLIMRLPVLMKHEHQINFTSREL
jgi:hypothetical protein